MGRNSESIRNGSGGNAKVTKNELSNGPMGKKESDTIVSQNVVQRLSEWTSK